MAKREAGEKTRAIVAKVIANPAFPLRHLRGCSTRLTPSGCRSWLLIGVCGRRDVPELHRAIVTAGRQHFSNGTKRHGMHKLGIPSKVACSLPVATSHNLIVRSALPDASILPSGLKATDTTAFCVSLKRNRFFATLPKAPSVIFTRQPGERMRDHGCSSINSTYCWDRNRDGETGRNLSQWKGMRLPDRLYLGNKYA